MSIVSSKMKRCDTLVSRPGEQIALCEDQQLLHCGRVASCCSIVQGIETLGVCQGWSGLVTKEILDASSLHVQCTCQHQTCQSVVSVLGMF